MNYTEQFAVDSILKQKCPFQHVCVSLIADDTHLSDGIAAAREEVWSIVALLETA